MQRLIAIASLLLAMSASGAAKAKEPVIPDALRLQIIVTINEGALQITMLKDVKGATCWLIISSGQTIEVKTIPCDEEQIVETNDED